MRLSVVAKEPLEQGKTIIFLDEIQICPNAITALKFLAQDDRIDVIVSGSTLGMTYKKVKSFPVGYVDRIYIFFSISKFCIGLIQIFFNYISKLRTEE